ncbi:MAG: hypothetical protein V1792_16385 [Pseudomonadota bacterium]
MNKRKYQGLQKRSITFIKRTIQEDVLLVLRAGLPHLMFLGQKEVYASTY